MAIKTTFQNKVISPDMWISIIHMKFSYIVSGNSYAGNTTFVFWNNSLEMIASVLQVYWNVIFILQHACIAHNSGGNGSSAEKSKTTRRKFLYLTRAEVVVITQIGHAVKVNEPCTVDFS